MDGMATRVSAAAFSDECGLQNVQWIEALQRMFEQAMKSIAGFTDPDQRPIYGFRKIIANRQTMLRSDADIKPALKALTKP